MRRPPAPIHSAWWGVLAGVVGLAVGTAAGHLLHDAVPLAARAVDFGPSSVGLYALNITVSLHANLLGLAGAAVGVVWALRR